MKFFISSRFNNALVGLIDNLRTIYQETGPAPANTTGSASADGAAAPKKQLKPTHGNLLVTQGSENNPIINIAQLHDAMLSAWLLLKKLEEKECTLPDTIPKTIGATLLLESLGNGLRLIGNLKYCKTQFDTLLKNLNALDSTRSWVPSITADTEEGKEKQQRALKLYSDFLDTVLDTNLSEDKENGKSKRTGITKYLMTLKDENKKTTIKNRLEGMQWIAAQRGEYTPVSKKIGSFEKIAIPQEHENTIKIILKNVLLELPIPDTFKANNGSIKDLTTLFSSAENNGKYFQASETPTLDPHLLSALLPHYSSNEPSIEFIRESATSKVFWFEVCIQGNSIAIKAENLETENPVNPPELKEFISTTSNEDRRWNVSIYLDGNTCQAMLTTLNSVASNEEAPDPDSAYGSNSDPVTPETRSIQEENITSGEEDSLDNDTTNSITVAAEAVAETIIENTYSDGITSAAKILGEKAAEAAEAITQSTYSDGITRATKILREKAAGTTIQAAYRGHQTRAQLQKETITAAAEVAAAAARVVAVAATKKYVVKKEALKSLQKDNHKDDGQINKYDRYEKSYNPFLRLYVWIIKKLGRIDRLNEKIKLDKTKIKKLEPLIEKMEDEATERYEKATEQRNILSQRDILAQKIKNQLRNKVTTSAVNTGNPSPSTDDIGFERTSDPVEPTPSTDEAPVRGNTNSQRSLNGHGKVPSEKDIVQLALELKRELLQLKLKINSANNMLAGYVRILL